MVTERPRLQPQLAGDTPVYLPTLCTEPSPDYAIAFNQTAKLSASVTGRGSGEADLGSAEVASQLQGRSAGVLALRDGLYAACQSYVNGVIGHDAYALILSQYGRELVELMHAAPATAADDVEVVKIKTKQAAFAALLVSCISQYDRTRIGGERNTPKNPVLGPAYCRKVMHAAAFAATSGGAL